MVASHAGRIELPGVGEREGVKPQRNAIEDGPSDIRVGIDR